MIKFPVEYPQPWKWTCWLPRACTGLAASEILHSYQIFGDIRWVPTSLICRVFPAKILLLISNIYPTRGSKSPHMFYPFQISWRWSIIHFNSIQLLPISISIFCSEFRLTFPGASSARKLLIATKIAGIEPLFVQAVNLPTWRIVLRLVICWRMHMNVYIIIYIIIYYIYINICIILYIY